MKSPSKPNEQSDVELDRLFAKSENFSLDKIVPGDYPDQIYDIDPVYRPIEED